MGTNKDKETAKSDNNGTNVSGVLFRVGTELFAGVAVGVGVGVACDNYFDTKPVLIILFFFLGCIAGFLNVFRIIKNEKNNF